MLIPEIIARVKTIDIFRGRVAGALELSALVSKNAKPVAVPCAFVVPIGEDPQKPKIATGLYRQLVAKRIGVLIVLEQPDDTTGAKLVDPLEAAKDEVIVALAGWKPDSAENLMELVRGRNAGLREGMAFYQLDFSADTFLRIST